MLPPSWKGEVQKAVEEATAAQSNQRKTEQNEASAKIAAAINSLRDAQQTQTSHEDTNDQKNRAINVTTLILVALTVLFTCLSWLAFRDQLGEMKKVYGPIKESADAAKDSAAAIGSQLTVMQGQLDEMKRQSALTISQLRPKLALSIKGPNRPMKLGDKTGWVLTPTWENHGGSEGIDFWGWDNARLFTPDAPADFDFLNLGRDPGAVPKTTISVTEPRLQLSKIITQDDVQSVIDNKGTFVLWGYVEYRESLPGNQAHHIHWCYKVFPTDAGDSWIFAHPLYRAECNSSD